MSIFRTIQGQAIRSYAGDPSNPVTGQIWYNTSSNTFKTVGFTYAWSSGGNLGTARAYMFGVGPQTAALGAGGYNASYSPVANSEEYNGTAWTEGSNLNTARYGISGAGTQTAAVAVGGYPTFSNAEEYNGSSWTNVTAYPVALYQTAGAGTQTAGVLFGGSTPTKIAQTTEYDGSSWTTSAPQNLNTARSGMGSGGTQTAAIGFAGGENGGPPDASNKTETYDGSTWTVGPTLINSFNNSRNTGGGGPNTSTTDILAAGGPIWKTEVEGYDGTSWSAKPALATGRSNLAGGGTNSTAVVFGGDAPGTSYVNATEEFTGTAAIQTLTTS